MAGPYHHIGHQAGVAQLPGQLGRGRRGQIGPAQEAGALHVSIRMQARRQPEVPAQQRIFLQQLLLQGFGGEGGLGGSQGRKDIYRADIPG